MKNEPYKILKWFWIAEDLHIRAILTTASKSWYVQWQQPGHGKSRQRRQSLHTTSEKEARIRGQRFARAFESGQIPTTSQQAATVEKVIALKLDRLEANGASIHTLRLYAWYFAMLCEVLPRKGQSSIALLTPLTLTAFATRLRTQGVLLPSAKNPKKHKARTLAPRTVREVLKAVRGLVRLAKSLKLIAGDPTDGYVLPKGRSGEVQVFSPQELSELFADSQYGEIWTFLAHAALRLEEFCWLMKTDVVYGPDGAPAAIHIRHKTDPLTGQVWWPKHKIERLVPLTPVAAAILVKAMKSSTGPWAFEAGVTHRSAAGKWPGWRVRAALERRLGVCAITHGTPHVFRHTCASHLANIAKMPVTLLQRFLGHRSLESTMRYLHTRSEDVAQALSVSDFSALASPAGTPPAPSLTPAPAPVVPPVPVTPTTNDVSSNAIAVPPPAANIAKIAVPAPTTPRKKTKDTPKKEAA